MRTCAVPGCKGVLSLPGGKVHKLPDQEPQRGQWIKAVPQLSECKVKTPSICALHFTASDYGKNRKYLKPTAVPSRHLSLVKEDQVRDDIPEIIQSTQFGKCDSNDCQSIFIAAKNLATQNQCLTKHIKALEKKLQHVEAELKKSATGSPLDDSKNEGLFMLGPTQLRCLKNRTTKGRNWTQEERSKANTLKNMTSHKCYNYIRKNIVPLPCPSELANDQTIKGQIEVPEDEAVAQKVETFILKSNEVNAANTKDDEVHIVVPPEFQEFLVLQSISE